MTKYSRRLLAAASQATEHQKSDQNCCDKGRLFPFVSSPFLAMQKKHRGHAKTMIVLTGFRAYVGVRNPSFKGL